MASLSELLESSDDGGLIELPLVHSTPAGFATSILNDKLIRRMPCKVIGKPVVYTFYGRPAFDNAEKLTGFKGRDLLPVCFVLKPCWENCPIDAVYPFDSGAAHGGRFSPYITKADFQSYQLKPSIDSVRKLAKQFFSSNENYFYGNSTVTSEQFEDGISDYIALITNDSQDLHADDRRSAIEVILNEDVDLRKNLQIVLLPASLWQLDWVRDVIHKQLRLAASVYPTTKGLNAGYGMFIRERLNKVFREGGLYNH